MNSRTVGIELPKRRYRSPEQSLILTPETSRSRIVGLPIGADLYQVIISLHSLKLLFSSNLCWDGRWSCPHAGTEHTWRNLGIKSTLTWPTRNQVNPYPGIPLVTTFEKSTRYQSLGYELTHAFQGERSTRNLGKILASSSIKYYSGLGFFLVFLGFFVLFFLQNIAK